MEELHKKTLDLCLYQGIEDSKDYLDILYLELKLCKNKIEFLDKEKPFWFQKKKIAKYQKERMILEDKMSKCQKNILEELELISKMISN